MKDHVFIKSVPKRGPNGDRDPHLHPYFDYEVWLCKDGAKTKMHTVDGFDHFWTHIKDREEVRDTARQKARRLSRTLGLGNIWWLAVRTKEER